VNVGCGLSRATDPFFRLHRPRIIAFHTGICVLRCLTRATDHRHMNLLLFTHLLRKTSVIGWTKVKGSGGSGDRGRRSDPFCATCFLTFFSPSTFFSRSSRPMRRKFWNAIQPGKKGRPGIDHLHQLPTGRRMNFLVLDYEQTPYLDAHVCAPYNLMSKYVSHTERSRCLSFSLVFLPPESTLPTRNTLSLYALLSLCMNLFLQRKDHERAHLLVMYRTHKNWRKRLTIGVLEKLVLTPTILLHTQNSFSRNILPSPGRALSDIIAQ
jgi:hypothetical protein